MPFGEDLCRPTEACIRWRSRSVIGKGNFKGGRKGRFVVKYSWRLEWAQGRNHVLDEGPDSTCIRWMRTMAPPGEYDWTVHLRRRFGLLSNYFDHLLLGSIVVLRPIVTDRVVWSVGLSVTVVCSATTAQPIEMPFGLRAQVGPGDHVLDGVQIPP